MKYPNGTINQSSGGAGLTDGDKGDVVVSGSGSTLTLDSAVVTAAAKTVLDDASVSAMRTTLGAETAGAAATAQAAAVQRANHTGTQLASTISDFSTAADARVNTLVPAASTTVVGKVELATNAETIAGVDTVRAVVPAGLQAALAASGVTSGSITSITYTSGRVTGYTAQGVAVTLTYNANGSLNTMSDGTTTYTATYNADGSVATFA